MSSQIAYAYDTLGRLTSRTLNTPGWTTAYTYKAGAGSNTTTTQIATVTNPDGTYAYTYDAVGNITGEQKDGITVAAYTYDGLNQLTAATVNGTAYAYTYDNHGNILTATEGGTTHTYTYGDSVWKDKLTAYDGQAITYDAIGNPLTYRNGMVFTWQNGRQLATATVDGVTASYVYNADGGRHAKTVDGVTTTYYTAGGVLYALKTGSHKMAFLYDDAGTPFGFRYNGSQFYYVYNLQGDVVGIINTAGTRLVTYTYDPWGKPLALTDSTSAGIGTLNPFRYRGYIYDTETGLYYCNSRYYDPETGRFLNADSQLNTSLGILGLNQFSYCLNSPVNMVDYDGNKPGDLFDTMDEAARDAAVYLGALSFENGWEYGTNIYIIIIPIIKISWNNYINVFGISIRYLKISIQLKCKYSYTEPTTNKDPWGVTYDQKMLSLRVATLHTHPMGSGLGVTRFSPADKENAKKRGAYNYVHGPNGQVLKYDPWLDKDIPLFDDLPHSINKPWLE